MHDPLLGNIWDPDISCEMLVHTYWKLHNTLSQHFINNPYFSTLNRFFQKVLTFCSGGPVSLELLLHVSRVPFRSASVWPDLWGSLKLSLVQLCHLLLLSVFRLLYFLCWLWAKWHLSANRTSSVVLLISDPKTHESHCFSHKSTWKCNKTLVKTSALGNYWNVQ